MSHPDYIDIGTPPTKMIEECSELIQALCKADRFGWSKENIGRIDAEIDDVLYAIDTLKNYLKKGHYE
jgi:hypothetical protein